VLSIRGLYFDQSVHYREDLPIPQPASGEALVRVKLAAICQTDMELIRGYKNYQGILGHEFVGVVEESSNPELAGRRVVGEINIGCGQCSWCKKEVPNHCPYRRVLGILNKDGAFAEYITLPEENLHLVPDQVTDEEAVFAEPLAAALEVTNQVHICPADQVAILGDGKLSYLTTQVLALTGCALTVIGKHRVNLEQLQEYAQVLHLDELNGFSCYDKLVECTGNDQGLRLAGKLIKPRGTIILKSTYAGGAKFNPSDWVVKEVNLVGSRCGPLDGALRLLENKLIQVHPLLGKRYTPDDYLFAFSMETPGSNLFSF